jgi:hypothetical protein
MIWRILTTKLSLEDGDREGQLKEPEEKNRRQSHDAKTEDNDRYFLAFLHALPHLRPRLHVPSLPQQTNRGYGSTVCGTLVMFPIVK